MKNIIVGLLIACLTTACGWQLRGSMATHENLKSVYISAEDTHGALVAELKQLLKSNNVALVEDSSAATLSLIIRDENQDRRTAAVGSDALTSAYELFLTVHYHLQNAKGAPVSSQGSAMVTRTFNYSAAGASSGAREEALVLAEMRRELAQQLVRRLSALSANIEPPTTSESTQAEHNGQAAP